MRVLLIYSNQSRELVPAPPVGLSYVATAARSAGHDVTLLDLAFSGDLLARLAAAIAAFRPEVVGLSIRNIDNLVRQRFDSPLHALLQQVAVIRAKARSATGKPVPLVIGGPAISVLAERSLEVFGADYAIVGEGEAAFPALLDALSRGEFPARIPGLCYREDGVARCNRAVLLARFANSGMQQWISWRNYAIGGGTWPIQTKRGCPMQCIYCCYPLIEGIRLRQRDPGEVVEEIAQVLRDVRPRTFEIVDSTFNLPASHSIAICEEILRRGIKANFTAMGINPLDVPSGLFPLMKRAGFNSMMITPEAGCDAMLDNLGKGFSMKEVNACLELAKDSGLKSRWFFMLGGPGETMRTCEESIQFARTRLTGNQFAAVFFTGIRILPGTALARQSIER
ncbi:MAG: cobalamin-dependent protein, partial [Pseudomonadota bacterium]